MEGIAQPLLALALAFAVAYFYQEVVEPKLKAWQEKEERIERANHLLDELEEDEEEYELEDEDSFYQDDSDTYVVPVPVHRSESAPRQQTRAKQHGFEIWRYYGASPLKIGERLSQSQAVQFAQQKCNDRSQPFGSSFVVREKDSGATIFSGQRVK